MPQYVTKVNVLFKTILIALWIGCCYGGESGLSGQIRVAAFNASLNRAKVEQLPADLAASDEQAKAIACIIQTVRPDVLLLNEFDYDSDHKGVQYFIKDYLAVSQHDASPIHYPYYYTAGVNTGVPSGYDLDHDGRADGPGDAFGYGLFGGQYGMVILSKYPIQADAVRIFQRFLWKDMPQAMLPDNPDTRAESDWYSAEELDVVRLSSKSHWDVPVKIGNHTLHLLVSHPTPPVFDGPDDRNGRRNHDEIRFWADYITADKSGYIYDDSGKHGGIAPQADFVVLGDLNADPHDGDSTNKSINQLLHHPRIQDTMPASEGAVEASRVQKGMNLMHSGLPEHDTYQSPPGQAPGNLRLDYVLPSCGLEVLGDGVCWPEKETRLSTIVSQSDHRMVYVDIQLNGS